VATPIPSNQAEFSLEELVKVTSGVVISASGSAQAFRGISTDTRAITAGAVFVALSGERFDGHAFVDKAREGGATLAIVERELPVAITQLVVADSLRALGQVAAFHRQRWGGAVVAIAGAAGKTTTRAVTSAILQAAYGDAVHSTLGNLNNRIGVPMVLLGLTSQHRFAVVEVGTNQTGEVPELTDIVKPDVAVLTLVDLEHSEGLGGLDAIEAEEGAIFGSSCHTLVVNGDDPRALRQAHQAAARAGRDRPTVRLSSYGFGPDVTLRAASYRGIGVSGSELRIVAGARELEVRVPIVGRPACYAVLAATAAAEALTRREFDEVDVQAGLDLPSLKPEGRAEVVTGPSGEVIVNDSYNANPASMRAAVMTAGELAAQRGGRLHLVLGEMRELGAESTSAHAAMGEFLGSHEWASLFAIGAEMAALVDNLVKTIGRADAVALRPDTVGIAEELRGRLRPSDVILVKGSRGVRTEAVIAELLSQKVKA
jgi:UDP-N-acetylmuramoyl-tripeptide--D-alanyl-D-alanine ligase